MTDTKTGNTSGLWIPSLIAGTVIGFVITISAISLASLLFTGSLDSKLSHGIGMVLVTSAFHSIVLSFISSCSGIISRAQEGPVVVTTAAITSIVATSGTMSFGTILVFIAITTIVTGVFLLLLAQFQLGGLVRYLPYPVIGGFLSGTGALLLLGALGVMSNIPLTLDSLPGYFSLDQLVLWLPGLCYGIIIFFGMRHIRHLATLPMFLLVGLAIFYAALFLSNTSIQEATNSGLLIGNVGGSLTWSPDTLLREFDAIRWASIWSQIGNMFVIVIITSISLLLNISGIEVAIREDLDLTRELRSLGLLNIASGIGGGMIGFHSASMTNLSHNMKARTPYIGLIAGSVPLFALFFGSGVLAYIPVPLLGALLTFLGLNFSYTWIVNNRRSLLPAEYLALIAITIVIIIAGFLIGTIFGLVIMGVIFLINYSRIDIFHHVLSGADVLSNVERNSYHRRELNRLGQQIFIMELRGFIFFGTANRVLEALNARLQAETAPLSFFILDFRRVTRIDSSAAFSFNKALYKAEAENFTIIFSRLSPQIEEQLANNGILGNEYLHFFPDLDHALEWAEDQLIERDRVTRVHMPTTLELQLADRGLDKAQTEHLKTFLEPLHLEENDILIHEGEDANALYFIELGQVTVYVDVNEQESVRLQSLASGTLVGEIGFILQSPRTATVKVDTTTIAYRLSREAMMKMQSEAPNLAFAFKDVVLRIVSERIVAANREIAALNR